MHSVLRPSLLALLTAGALLCTPLAFAQTPWQAAHPNRTQVIQRADHLDHRIAHARWVGAISPQRAAVLQRQVAQVRWRQQVVARHHGGRLSRAQWLALNRQENAISREIGQ